MKEYIFYQVGAIMLYGSFQESNFILFLSPYFNIWYFNDNGRIYKKSNLTSNSLVKDWNHISHSIGVYELNACYLC